MAFELNPTDGEKNNFLIRDKNLFINKDGSLPSFLQLLNIHMNFEDTVFFREKENHLCAKEVPSEYKATELMEIPIREYFANHKEEDGNLAARSKSIIEWINSMRFCPGCGKSRLQSHPQLSALTCPSCGKIYFPRIEPCVIVLVHKGDEILLVRHSYRNQDMFACIAGFMEAGESAEHAVHREVFEETGLKIKNITYKGSQSWPFPDQIMLAFTAEYESGEIKIQEEEIAEARWFKKSAIPAGPKPGSVAWNLINDKFQNPQS